MRYEIAQDTV